MELSLHGGELFGNTLINKKPCLKVQDATFNPLSTLTIMAHAVLWPKNSVFYPIGNLPPVCLTQDLAPEEPAEMLLFGYGDPRSILYTI
jgi:hypothetical protein